MAIKYDSITIPKPTHRDDIPKPELDYGETVIASEVKKAQSYYRETVETVIHDQGVYRLYINGKLVTESCDMGDVKRLEKSVQLVPPEELDEKNINTRWDEDGYRLKIGPETGAGKYSVAVRPGWECLRAAFGELPEPHVRQGLERAIDDFMCVDDGYVYAAVKYDKIPEPVDTRNDKLSDLFTVPAYPDDDEIYWDLIAKARWLKEQIVMLESDPQAQQVFDL